VHVQLPYRVCTACKFSDISEFPDVDAGCNPHAQNLAGETPLHRAARRGCNSILEYLLSQGALLPHDILLASQTATTLRFFLGKGLDVRSVATDDVTDLMHRVLDLDSPRENHTVEFARILIGAGWDPALKNSVGKTAMHVAARNGKIDAIKFFISQNVPLPSDILLAAILPPSDASVSAGLDAYTWRVVPLTRFLIREGAGVNVAASNGNTPLHLVMMHNFTPDQDHPVTERLLWRLVEILLNGNSDPFARNMNGQTPYDLAEAKGHFFKENFLRLVRNSS
jgi:ankyrin repeat protein